MNTEKYPKFINSEPSGQDLFESLSHNKIAEAIVNQLKNKDSDYRLIGLDGSWGAGKSNVIRIIEKKLGENYHVFIYDAWSHQEDLQRRSFLEELTDDLQENNIIKPKKWKEKLDDLLAKKRSSVTKTIPKLSYAAIAAFLLIILNPVAKTISDSVDRNWKITISCLPLAIAVAVCLFAYLKDKEKFNLNKLFFLFKDKELETTLSETIAEKEPSVREFRQWINELSKDADKDVIIVFDNMDRLPSTNIQKLWSLIHTFFTEYNKNENIWVIVPFDRWNIRKAFENEVDESDHYINKTFSIVFQISPPVLTDWQSFFKIKFCDAFGAEDGEHNIVKNLFGIYQQDVTPRKIVSFLNDVVALKLVWQEEIALRFIALFILNKKQILQNPSLAVLDGAFARKALQLFEEQDNISDNIAALVYNVDVHRASQITLSKKIETCIRKQDENQLIELNSHENFDAVIENIIANGSSDIDFNLIVSALNAFENISTNKLPISVWQLLVNKQFATSISTQEFTQTHEILINKAKLIGVRKNLCAYIVKQIVYFPGFNEEKYFNALSAIRGFIKENNVDVDLFLLLPDRILAPNQFINYIRVAKEQYRLFKVDVNIQELENLLVHQINSGVGLEIIKYLLDRSTFPNLLIAIEDKIHKSSFQSNTIANIFSAYKLISKEKPLTKILSCQIINTEFTKNTNPKNNQDYYELVAMRLSYSNRFTLLPQIANNKLININDIDPTSIIEISSRIEFYITYGNILLESLQWNNLLLRKIAKELTERPVGKSSLDICEVIGRFEKIVNAIEVSEDDLFKRLNSYSSELRIKLNKFNIKEIIQDVNFYKIVSKKSNDITAKIIEVSFEYINSLKPKDWVEACSDPKLYDITLLESFISNEMISIDVFSINAELLLNLRSNVSENELNNMRKLQNIINVLN